MGAQDDARDKTGSANPPETANPGVVLEAARVRCTGHQEPWRVDLPSKRVMNRVRHQLRGRMADTTREHRAGGACRCRDWKSGTEDAEMISPKSDIRAGAEREREPRVGGGGRGVIYRERRDGEERRNGEEKEEEKGEAVAAQDDGRTGSHEDHCGNWWEAAEARRPLIGREEENDVRAELGPFGTPGLVAASAPSSPSPSCCRRRRGRPAMPARCICTRSLP